MEFKLYESLGAGGSAQGVCVGGATDDCVWSETRTGVNQVRVKSGYLTVHLGDISGFPSTISWDQNIYLTMNIYNPTTTNWDGEMTPRLKLTSVPFAFAAKQLSTNVGAHTGTLSFASSLTNNPDITLPNMAGTNNLLLQSGTTVLSQGSVPFVDATGRLTQDNSNFFFGDTNNRMGVGNAQPNSALDLRGALTVHGVAAHTVRPSGHRR